MGENVCEFEKESVCLRDISMYVQKQSCLRYEASDFIGPSSFWTGSPRHGPVFSFMQTIPLVSYHIIIIYTCMFTVASLAFTVSLPAICTVSVSYR